jgi:TolA-binding protein/predicted negative regulator of RcsB-dependent stress response
MYFCFVKSLFKKLNKSERMNSKQILWSVLFGMTTLAGSAQQSRNALTGGKNFEEGRQLFIDKNYPAAEVWLQECLKQSTLTPQQRGEADYMLACSSYELQREECIEQLETYLKQYPESAHRYRVEALIANANYFQEDYAEAIRCFEECHLEYLSDEERDASLLHWSVALIESNRLQEAYSLLNVLQRSSKSEEVLTDADYYKAYIDYTEGRYAQALPVFERLRNSRKYAAEVPYYIAEIQCAQQNYRAVLQEVQEYQKRFPNHANNDEMQRLAGEAYYGLGIYESAVNYLENYARLHPSVPRNTSYKLGLSYYHLGAYLRAAEQLGKATYENDAMAQNAYLHIGLSYLQLHNKAQARMAFEQASTMTYDLGVKEQALYNYALCIHETSYSPFAESVTVFERFLNEYPNSTYTEQVNDYLVEVYLETKSYAAALQSIAKISRPGTRILQAKQKLLFRKGCQTFANSEFAPTIDYMSQSLTLASYDRQTAADAYYWRGEAKYRLEQFPEAASDFKQYLSTTKETGDTYALALYNLGYTAFKQQSYNEAGNRFEQFVCRSSNLSSTVYADAYNRLADCRFYNRRFDEARQLYTRANELNPSAGDYSLYQIGFVQGLQHNYSGKVTTLNRLIDSYPSSAYVDDALYERGRAYMQMENNDQAISSFRTLVSNYPESALARKAAAEIGLLYYQNDRYPEAMTAYKEVISNYPGSEEAMQAQRDLKSIYIDLNDVDGYARYVASQKGAITLAEDERDSLTYIAAERAYMRGETAAASNSFSHYLQVFPQGQYQLNAHYYLGVINYQQGKTSEARTHLDKVIESPHNDFSEEAMVMGGELAFNAKEYDRALTIYTLLKEKTASADRRLLAQTGILRSAYLKNDTRETILAANELLTNQKLTPELANEARYDRAKAALATQPAQAVGDLKVLAADTRNLYGAEAKYRLAQYYFDNGDADAAEKEVLDYIEVSTPHAYWLARSFVLLSDVYAQSGRTLEARQYLLSLKQNYQADDDIATLIESRLNNLK